MRKNKFVIGIVLGIGLVIAGGRVEAKEKQFHARYTGTATNKDDSSFTGPPGSYATVAGKSSLGEYTTQMVIETSLDGSTCTPPGGGSGVELVFVGEVAVLSFTERGDQLFLKLNPSGV